MVVLKSEVFFRISCDNESHVLAKDNNLNIH